MSAISVMFRFVLFSLCLLAGTGAARAEWAELMKDEEITYVWDKDSVRAVHVSRIAWTMTNNPAKVDALRAVGVEVVERVPHELPSNPHNHRYLATKRDRSGHVL